MTSLHTTTHATNPHVHFDGEQCPLCGQPVPNDRLAELRRRIASGEQQRQAEVDARIAEETAALGTKLAEIETARLVAEKRMVEVEASHEVTMAAKLLETRTALEKDRDTAVTAERVKAFEDKQKLENALTDLQRQLQQKTAGELGEGAEVDLYEELKREFEADKIERVEKGAPGVDIIHDVRHNGMVCGRIVYDSKNRKAWRSEYCTKLRADQIAAKADHAVLSSYVFPANQRQIAIVDSVIVVNPARALVIATLLRAHILRTHSLRVGNEQRQQKTDELYTFITSERCTQHLDDIMKHAEDILELDAKERRAHETGWKKRSEIVRAIQRARSQMTDEIERIIGIAVGTSDA